LGDGRNYALVTDKQYDVISIDATSPKMAGNGSLYTLEFYKLVKERLSPDGLLVQWIPFHLLSDAEVRMVAKTFMTVFPHTTLWYTALRQHIILVGMQEELRIDFEAVSEKLARESIQAELAPLSVADPIDFLSWFIMGEEKLAEYAAGAQLNTDNHPLLEFTPAMAYFVSERYRVRNLVHMRDAMESVFPFLVNVGDTEEEIAAVAEKVQRRFEARYHSLSGDAYLRLGLQERATAEYGEALRIDPQEKNELNSRWH
jgi:spermidine synthase